LLTLDLLELVDPVIGEAEPGAGDELPGAGGNEDLSRPGDRHDPGARMDGDPTELAFDPFRFPEMDTRPDLDSERPDAADEHVGATDRGGQCRRRGEDTIARGIDEIAVEPLQGATYLVVMSGEKRTPSRVTDLCCDPG
jgi:hypothetical protein